jgi:hypothetical protein
LAPQLGGVARAGSLLGGLLTQKQHERANQRKHAHTYSEAIGLDQNIVVDQHDAERGWQHDGKHNQENDDPVVLHGASACRTYPRERALRPPAVRCSAQVLGCPSPINGELEEADAVCAVAGLLGGAGADVGVAVEDLGERRGRLFPGCG